ncbi:transcriptional repressor CTCF-like isoform X2 [Ruditapes philippinarum]|uniref:transcriptional repressor CTCF-like isoform X2 n=1 Tax=Ruditapes philippinarum TaxID=129788 RepID=UPI00295B0F44|nr:transcriptional repressor CTCF-like isoform X2 [Ruditapes philippinarum]
MEDEAHNGGLGDPGPQNLNDLQSYLVNFNKEIGVHGEGSAFHHTVSQMINQAAQPVFVSVSEYFKSSVSSETTTPDEEQLPVISDMKEQKSPDISTDIDGAMTTGEETLNSAGAADDMIYEMTQKQTPLDQVVIEAQNEALEPGRVTLQELNLEQLGLQHQAIAVSDGMIMLPMGDACNLLGQATEHKLAQVQIVNINGQPTLQLIGDSSLLQSQLNSTAVVGSEPQAITSIIPNASLQSLIDTTNQAGAVTSVDCTNPVAVLASVAANTNSVNQLQAHQLQNIQIPAQETQLVALRDGSDSGQPQVLALSYTDIETGAVVTQQEGSSLLKKSTGYQSVAILPSGDTSQGEVNYVLIVNPAGDKDNNQGPTYDFGDNITGEVVEEITDETGATKRLVKINQLVRNNTLNLREVAADQLACSHCDYTSPKKYLLSRHMKSHCDDRPHKCGICNRGFKTVSSLQNHINTHAGVRPHKCKMCESAFTTSGELIRHIRYKHTFEKPHKCMECDYASVELSKLKRHMRSHTGERPYACNYCNYASPDTYKLKRHMRIHTGEKPYECDICHAKFTQSNSLKAHKLIHSGNKPVFQCSLCPTTCGRKTDLKIHMQKLHSTDQPLLCKKCGETFPDRYTFKVHFKSHEGEKCFKCTECDYSAISQRHVDTHMLVHSGLKPFECEDCDLAFRQKALLKRHRNLYHNPHYIHQDMKDKEPECKACEKSFANKNNLTGQIQSPGDTLTIHTSDESENDLGNIHTCGGCPKSLVDNITPLTADQLIENSLLADMKEGKLGTSPKVVVVHPDGRVEEVTAKLQSLSQSKPMDDFLVSLGVSGDSHFDQVSGLPAEVCVSEVHTLVSMKDDNSMESQPKYVQSSDSTDNIEVNPVLDTGSFQVGTIVAGLDIDQTKEEGTQASFDSDDDDKKVKVLSQEQFLSLAQGSAANDLRDCFEENGYRIIQVDQPIVGNVPQIVVSMLSNEENRSEKRASDVIVDVIDDETTLKRLRTESLQAVTDE